MIKSKTEKFNDGVVRIYETKNDAAPGSMPVEADSLKHELRFRERTVGNQRHFLAMQNGVKISRVIRCPFVSGISAHDVAVICDSDDEKPKRYKVQQVQEPESVKALDLSLSLLDWGDSDV